MVTTAAAPIDPSPDAGDRVLAVVAGLLPADASPRLDSGLRELGLGSLALTRLWLELRREFGVDLGVAWLGRCGTVRELVARLAELREAGTGTAAGARAAVAADPAGRYAPFPLTELQQAYLVGKDPQLSDDPIGCHVYREFEVPDADVDRLVAGWWTIVERHDALRLVLTPDGRQQVQPPGEPGVVPVHDRTAGSVADFEAHLAEVRDRLSHHRYDPTDDRLWTVEISLAPGGRAVVHLSIDVLCVDGHGLSVLLADWSRAYRPTGPAAPPVPMTVRDCLAELATQRRAPDHATHLDYWAQRLRSVPDGPVLPGPAANEPRRIGSCHRRGALSASVGAGQWATITRLAREWAVSPTALVFTLFAEAFVAAGATAPLSLVLTTSDRMRLPPEADPVVGPFTSSVVVPVPDTTGLPVREAARTVHEQLWTDLEHAAVSGVTALRRRRTADRTGAAPKLPVVFTSLLEVGAASPGEIDFEAAVSYAISQTSGVWLDHQMWERDGALHVRWDVVEEAFPVGAVRTAFARFLNSLEALTDQPADLRTMNELQQAYFVPRAMFGPAPWDGCQVYHSFHVEDLDLDRLAAAWLALVAAHDVLRTVVDHDGRLAVSPATPGRWHLPVVDLRGRTDVDGSGLLDHWREAMVSRAFPLGRGPHAELRVSLGTGPAGAATVHITTDLTVSDGRSIHFLVRELFRHYADPAAVPRSGPADGAATPAATATGELDRTAQLAHWRDRVASLAAGPLPPPPAGPGPRVRYEDTIGGLDAIRAAAAAAGLALDDLLAAAYTTVLARRFPTPFSLPVVRWTPAADRLRPGEHTALSWITRTDPASDLWAEAARIREVLAADAGADGVSGLTELRRRVMRERRSGHFALSIVYTGLLELTGQPLPPGVRLGRWLTCTPDVSLDCVSIAEGDLLRLYWDCVPAHFPSGDVEAMFAEYVELVRGLGGPRPVAAEGAAGEPAGPLGPAERRKILYDWNATDHPYPVDGPVHRLFEEQVRRRPDAVAVRWATGTMSYAELDRRAEAVAGALRAAGVGQETPVGISVPRGPELVAAVFGVLKAGGFYVPLEPSLPAERALMMVEDAGLSLVLTSTDRTGWPIPAELGQLPVDGLPSPRALAGATGPPPAAGVDATAYVIFTSGSTGRPKGVAVAHRSLRNLLNWCYRTHHFGPDDVGVCVTSLGFDLSVFDLFGLLGCGASVYIADEAERRDPQLLLDVLLREPITFWNSAPTSLNQLAPLFGRHHGDPRAGSLRLVYLSGDYTPLPLPGEIRALFPRARVVSLGGATEATVWSNWFEVGEVDPRWRSIPYGRPIDNARYYILDQRMEPCPVGVEGDLFIGGDCLSLGYHRRPELTAERFVPDPFTDRPGARLYRTGDRAYYFPDGTICFAGRADNQVKIRGFRVELGEVEHRLRGCAGVKDVVVLARPDPTGDRKLVAYVVPAGDPPPAVRELRRHAAETLPDYSVPNVVAFVDGFPATANGKLDRDALPWPVEPGSQHALLPTERPTNPAQDAPALVTELSEIFAELLGLPAVQPDTDIWDQGATSYTMVQVSAALQQRYGRRVPVSVLLADPTVAGIARAVRAEHGEPAGEPAPAAEPAAQPAPAAEPVPQPATVDVFSAAEQAAFKSARHDLRPADPDQAVVGLPDAGTDPGYLGRRATRREFQPRPVPASDLARLLGMLRETELDGRRRRRYPSAGDTYAVQAYLHVRDGGVDGVPGGFYYYHPVEHALHLVDARPDLDRSVHFVYNRPVFDQAGFGIYLFGYAGAIEPLYAEDADRFLALEAGYLGQTLMLGQAECGIGLCPVGNVAQEPLRARLRLTDQHRYLQSFLAGPVGGQVETAAHPVGTPAEAPADPVITGVAARLPGVDDLDGFWRLLCQGRTAIAPPSPSRAGQVVEPANGAAGPVPAGGFLDEIDTFDSLRFRISPREADTLDPQLRILLHTVSECLESAGHSPESLRRGSHRVGVFLGAMWQDHQLAGMEHWRAGEAATVSATASDAANRISHVFGFDGPSVAVDTSCSSSAAAVHLAVQSLRRGECDTALVAAANVFGHPYHLRLLTDLGLLAAADPAGAYDAGNPGWVPGEGAVAVLLRTPDVAERDRDHVLAVLEASRIGHLGGAGRFGAPDASALRRSIAATLAGAGVDPGHVDYVECAAAGAALSDAAELEALNQVFAGAGSPVPVGTVKPTVGHLEAAAGLSQLVKVLLQLRYGQLAPTRLAGTPGPLHAFDAVSPVTELRPWPPPAAGRPRRALITTVGAAGSYGHLIVRSAGPVTIAGDDPAGPATQVVLLSADGDDQLRSVADRLGRALAGSADRPAPRLVDVAFTTQTGRTPLTRRLAVRCRSLDELREALAAYGRGEPHPAVATGVAAPEGATVAGVAGADPVAAVPGWLAGRPVDWSRFWTAGTARRVPLPTTPFAGQPHRLAAGSGPARPAGEPADPGGRAAKALAYVTRVFAEVTGVPVARLHPRAPLESFGLTSYLVSALNERMLGDLGEVSRTLFFAHPDLAGVAAELAGSCPAFAVPPSPSQAAAVPAAEPGRGAAGDRIAVVGLAGRYPQSPDLDAFWRNLRDGRDCVGALPADRRRPDWPVDRMVGGFLDDVDRFDPLLFGITPRDAARMDPQERLFLETAWHALEDAGYPRSRLRRRHGGRVGVFVGSMYNEYPFLGLEQVAHDPAGRRAGRWQSAGSAIAGIANRVSYTLDLTGPSLTVDTMCSSSLTALHLAVTSLQRGECEAALVGGVNLSLHPNKFVQLAELGMASSDGRCRSFGAGGDGFVPSEGVGAMLLKPLDAAIADGDRVLAVILGTAVNHGGRTNGYTVPSPVAQAALISRALAAARVEPADLGYLEAHGTGTALGDPVEIDGLRRAFGAGRPADRRCAIGSVKSNIGHAEAAAGIAGLTKVILQMRHRTLVPSIHIDTLNPDIDWDRSPLRLQRAAEPWLPGPDGALRAGVSSFGAGGSGAHVVVESAPPAGDPPPASGPRLIVLSARTPDRLTEVARRLLDQLAAAPAGSLADIAYTLQVGREPLRERLALEVADLAELRAALSRFVAGEPTAAIRGRAAQQEGPPLSGVAGQDLSLAELGGHWVAGGEVDWEALPGGPRRVVELPGYPFERMRCWLDDRPAAPTVPSEVALLTREWRATDLAAQPMAGPAASGTVLCLHRPDQRELVAAVADQLRPARVVPVCQTDQPPADRTPILTGDASAAAALVDILATEHGPLTGWLDLCAGPGQAGPSDEHDGGGWGARLAVLQQLLVRRPAAGLRAVQVTSGLFAPPGPAPDRAGARLAGFVRVLGSEHPWVRADVVDVDGYPGRPADLAARLAPAWWRVTAAGQLCLRGGVALVPALTEVAPAGPDWSPRPDRAYVVTGGTGGLGGLVAAHLVRRGARRLAILGHQPLPPRHEWHRLDLPPRQARVIGAVTALERAGAQVMVETCDLTDVAAVDRILRRVREAAGGIAGVVHCAGRAGAGQSPLMSREIEDIRAVLAPKGDGLDTLAAVTEADPLEFFLLFGSVSGAVPALAAGIADYAAANSYLDHAASYYARAGRPAFRCVAWPVWRETGGAVDRPDAGAPVGLGALTDQAGLSVLDRMLSPDAPAFLLPCVPTSGFDAGRLLVANRPAVAAAPAAPTGKAVSVAQAAPAAPAAGGGASRWLVELFAEALRIPAGELDPDTEFGDLGVESVLLAELLERIEARVGRALEPALLLEHPTLELLSARLRAMDAAPPPEPDPTPVPVEVADRPAAMATGPAGARRDERRIAVIGMACRFPGAPDLDAFWRLLRGGQCAVREVPPDRWDVDRLYRPDGGTGYSVSRWGGLLDQLEDFDPDHFGMSDQEARDLDPAVRLVMEAAASCLSDAGYPDRDLRGRDVGVFIGARMSGYRRRIGTAGAATGLGGDQNFIAARLAHQYDLRGPNLVVDSACSSALVSVQLASRALLAGDAEIAFAGGVEVLLDEEPYLEFTAAGALSPRGRCATFARDADGFVPGEGVGLLLLKPLAQARRDGDRVHAVIESVAVGNDGHTMGLTTPNPVAQAAVVRRALELAGVAPGELGMIEAHGTATMLGDPIELRALTEVFREQTDRTGFCAIGSVKSNIGHLLSAAGVAGLIKSVLAVENGEIPPTLFCDDPNPRFDFAASPFFPNRRTRPWPGGLRRIAGVSAFGLGGTNAHAVVSSVEPDPAAHHHPRVALPAPVFHRRRLWWEREPVPAPAGSRPPEPGAPPPEPGLDASVLQLSFVS